MHTAPPLLPTLGTLQVMVMPPCHWYPSAVRATTQLTWHPTSCFLTHTTVPAVPVSPGHFLGGQLGLPQPPHFSKDPHQSLPTRNSHPNPRIPRQPAPPGYQPSSHRFEPHRPLRRTNSHPSDGSFDNDDHEGTPPGQLPWMPQSSGWSMQHFGGYVDQQATHSNPTYPSQSNSNTFYRRTTHAPVPSMVSFRCSEHNIFVNLTSHLTCLETLFPQSLLMTVMSTTDPYPPTTLGQTPSPHNTLHHLAIRRTTTKSLSDQ